MFFGYQEARWFARILLLMLVEWGASGCGGNRVTGRITPAHFQFKTVVAKSATKPSGWQAVCIHALIRQGDSGATTVCKFEVGLPLRNEQQKDISLEWAQWVAADTANAAAYEVLSVAHPGEMLAVLCNQFKERYELMLQDVVAGARVGMCQTRGLDPVHFDVPWPHPCDE